MTIESRSMLNINSLSEISDKYTHFAVDLWGVIIDGYVIYDGVISCLKELLKQGKKIIFFSNVVLRYTQIHKLLDDIGITRDLYSDIITSGEVTHEYLKQNLAENKISKQYFELSSKNKTFHYELANSGFTAVDDIKKASFIFALGLENNLCYELWYESLFAEAIEAKIPMVCANPDEVIVLSNSQLCFCAGILGNRYKMLGGDVVFMGKPHHFMYDKLIDLVKKDGGDTNQLLVVGDTLATDIVGANNHGFDNLWVTGNNYDVLSKTSQNDKNKFPEAESEPTFYIKKFIY